MHKRVRYYITESEDRPVVRTVSVAIHQDPNIDERSTDPPIGESERHSLDSKRSRLRARLKSVRHHSEYS